MSFRLIWDAVRGDYEEAFKAIEDPIAKAATKTIDDAKALVLTQGRATIASGGFSKRWQNALRATRYPIKGKSIEPAAWIFHKIPYAGVFETGARVSGSPLLWLPLPNVPNKLGGMTMTPRNYIRQVGPLHTIHVPGKRPMLAGYMRGSKTRRPTLSALRAGSALARLGVRHKIGDFGTRGVVSVPLFYGIQSVQLRKHFDIAGVVNRVQARIPAMYVANVEAVLPS